MAISNKPHMTLTKGNNINTPFNWFTSSAIVMVLLAVLVSIKPLYLLSKAALSQYLLHNSWQLVQQHSLKKAVLNKSESQQLIQLPPWPWADTYPIAKLSLFMNTSIEKSETNTMKNEKTLKPDISWIILAGMTGRTMAFGPGWLEHSAKPNHSGNTIISAHNDSHFDILEKVNIGDTFILEDQHNSQQTYQIQTIKIIDETDNNIYQYSEYKMLTLITCYPFTTTINNKSKRLIVTAIAI